MQIITKTSQVLFSFLFLLLLSQPVLSQDQLILSNGKTMKGSAITINKSKVKFEDAKTGRRKWYKKKEIKKLLDKQDSGAVIEYESRDIKGINSYLSGAVVSGKASIYIIHKATPGYQGIPSFIYLHRDGDDKAVPFKQNSMSTPFYKRMAKYFSDCPEVVKKLKAKKYEMNAVGDVVVDYNSTCGEK
ncbi:MAG: hypothetical protein AB8F74_07385 [Saprospiraceae bacterium]